MNNNFGRTAISRTETVTITDVYWDLAAMVTDVDEWEPPSDTRI